jgi:hypothetical protein
MADVRFEWGIAFFVLSIIVFVITNLGFMAALGLWTYTDAKERTNEPAMWTLIVLLTNIIGLIIYLAVGRDKTKTSSGKYKKLLIIFAIASVLGIIIYAAGLATFIMMTQ